MPKFVRWTSSRGWGALTCSSPRRRAFLAATLGLVLLAPGPAEAERSLPWHPVPPERHRAPLPVDEASEKLRLEVLGSDYRITRTDHFSIAHHRDSRRARYRGAILEDLYAAFTLYFEERGIALERPESQLPVVFTPTRERFVQVIGQRDLPHDVEGLYMRDTNIALFFDTMGRREVRERQAEHGRIRGDLVSLRRRIDAMDDDASVVLSFYHGPNRTYSKEEALELVDDELREARQSGGRFRYDRGQQSLETMTHEGAHQIAFAMGLLPKQASLPSWLVEGLATLFEPSANGFLLRTGTPHWARWARLKNEHDAGRRSALRDLIADDAAFADPEIAARTYDDAWSLVQFLSTRHADGFIAYLRAVGQPEAGRTPARRIALFESTFGARLQDLEASWHDHVDTLGTPDD